MIPLLILLENALAVAAQLSLRRGAARFADQPLALSILLEPVRNPFILSGRLLHGMSFFLYISILSTLQLNLLYPDSTGPSIVLITCSSVLFLGARLIAWQGNAFPTAAGGSALVASTSRPGR